MYYAENTDVYDAYGQLLGKGIALSSGGPQVQMIGFAGQSGAYTDVDLSNSAYSTGLVYMTHRYYDPKVGRFVNRDPIGYSGGINLYGYAGNNPITGSDPSGFDGGGYSPPDAWFNKYVGKPIVAPITDWGDRQIMHLLTAGTKFDNSKQPTLAQANRDNPAALAIKQGGQVVGKTFIPAVVGGLAISAATGGRSGSARDAGSFDSSADAALQMGMDRVIATGQRESVAGVARE